VDGAVVALCLLGVAGAVALVLARRGPDAPTQPEWAVPVQLDRSDFVRPEAPWLVVVFSAASCDACADAVAAAEALAGDVVAVQEVEARREPTLHRRYHIDAVPTLVVADAAGLVRASYIGRVSPAELANVVADLREHSP
jgi:protein-disulfide isomerase